MKTYSKLILAVYMAACVLSLSALELHVDRIKDEYLTAITPDGSLPSGIEQYELFNVYEKKETVNGETCYLNLIDSVYYDASDPKATGFRFLWKEAGKNIKKGYILVRAARKIRFSNEKIKTIIARQKADTGSGSSGFAFAGSFGIGWMMGLTGSDTISCIFGDYNGSFRYLGESPFGFSLGVNGINSLTDSYTAVEFYSVNNLCCEASVYYRLDSLPLYLGAGLDFSGKGAAGILMLTLWNPKQTGNLFFDRLYAELKASVASFDIFYRDYFSDAAQNIAYLAVSLNVGTKLHF